MADYFGFGRRAAVLEQLTAPPSVRRRLGIRTPWADPSAGNLPQVMAAEILGVISPGRPTRDRAMRVPAVARARHLLVTAIAQLPLVALDPAGPVDPQPRWLHRTDGPLAPQLRLAWTVDDLLFEGMSLWSVNRGVDPSRAADRAPILDAWRVPMEDWLIDEDLRILVLDQEVDPATVVLFTGLHEGLLTTGQDSIAIAADLEQTVARRARTPLALVELHQTTDDELTDEEIDALIGGYTGARRDPDGAVMWTPASIDTRVHTGDDGAALIQARNASAIDIARHAGIPAAMIDASNVNSSLTYETVSGRGVEFRDYGASTIATAIEARLSMDDCVPRGQRVRFDTSHFAPGEPTPTGTPTED